MTHLSALVCGCNFSVWDGVRPIHGTAPTPEAARAIAVAMLLGAIRLRAKVRA